MSRRLFAAVATAIVVATPAAAADFVGPRVEVHGGWDQMNFDLNDVGIASRPKAQGFTYGGSLGYDYRTTSGLIIGGEIGIDDTTADRRRTTGTTTYANIDARRDINASARVGTLISQAALLYAKVGYTNLQLDTTGSLAGTTIASRRDLSGVRVGAGAEVEITPRVYLKTEYDYSNYEKGVSQNALLSGVGFRF